MGKESKVEQAMWGQGRAEGRMIPIRLGLLINPHARGTQALCKRIPSLSQEMACYTSSHLHEIPQLLRRLLWVDRVTVLGICGGDGTIHHTLQALLSLWRESSEAPLPMLPPILLLRGGTMNIIARALHLDMPALSALERFLRRYRHAYWSQLPLVQQRLLRVESSRYGVRFGTVFGSEITARALQVYEEQSGGGYRGLLRFLREAVEGVFLKTPLWQQHAALLEGEAPTLTLDGIAHRYRAVVASTVDITLLRRWIQGLLVNSQEAGSMQVRLLGDVSPVGLIRHLPHLIFGWSAPAILDQAGAFSLQLQGAFSLDGEVFHQERTEEIEVAGTRWTWPIVRL